MQIRRYLPEDLDAVYRLFCDTVHAVNSADYSAAQLDAWAPKQMDRARWEPSLREHFTLVATWEGEIIGFADLAPDGYLDRLYVHKDFGRRGVASALVDGLEQYAKIIGVAKIRTDASITARPFFEKRGYQMLREQKKPLRGELFINYQMEKEI